MELTVKALKEILNNYSDETRIDMFLTNEYGGKFYGIDHMEEFLTVDKNEYGALEFTFKCAGTLPFYFELMGEHPQLDKRYISDEDLEDLEESIVGLRKELDNMRDIYKERKDEEYQTRYSEKML